MCSRVIPRTWIRWNEDWAITTDGGKVPRYITTMGSLEAAFSIGEHFTVLPKLYAGWYRPFGVNLRDVSPYPYVNIRHVVTVGGFIPDRYTENPIPWRHSTWRRHILIPRTEG